jgi:lipopolysaccharide transport system ATP-binding protein
MNDIGKSGTTVLFVSHSVHSVLSLCNKGIFLESGQLKAFEEIKPALSRYMKSCPAAGLHWEGQLGDEHISFYEASLRPTSHLNFFLQGDATKLDLEFEVLKPHDDLIVGFNVKNSKNQVLAHSRLCDCEENRHLTSKPGVHKISFDFDLALFHPGEYQIEIESQILNRKKILQGDLLLKFAVCSQSKLKQESNHDFEGLTLGHRWHVQSYTQTT